MRSKFGNLAVLATVLLVGSGPAHANSLTNGSFESGAFSSNTGQDTMKVAIGDSTTIAGWTVISAGGGRTDPLAWIGPTNPFGVAASDGSYFLDLTGYHDGLPYAGVSQTINTIVGHNYQLSFDLGASSNWGGQNAVQVTAGGYYTQIWSPSAGITANSWYNETLAFTATNTSSLIAISGFSGNAYIGLDNVSVVDLNPSATPLPSTWLLLLSGFVGLGYFAYRGTKKRTAAIAAA